MPPKKKPSAPVNRVYKSSTPHQQTRFPVRTTSVRYGKRTSARIPKQDTLTQMDFLHLNRPLDNDDEDLENYEKSEKPKKKRRKTTGDEPFSESKYRTQTITQLDWSVLPEPEEDDSINSILGSSPRSKKLRRQNTAKNGQPGKLAIQRPSRRKSAPSSMGPPQTPHRRRAREIPSSESPVTPPFRTSPFKGSALKERSIKSIPFDAGSKLVSPSKPSKLIVEDSFESDNVSERSRILKTPSKRSSPAKSVRWAIQEETNQVDEDIPKEEQDIDLASLQPKQMKDEILDSEDDESYQASESDLSENDQDVQAETCYGEIGLETQKLLETPRWPASPCVEESQLLCDRIPDELLEKPRVAESPEPGGEMLEEVLEGKSQVTDCQLFGEDISEHLDQEKTQYMESQRLATQHLHKMAPRTKFSDVFVSIQPQNVTKIVNRTKNHEFRRQMIPDTVSRMWIYETYPTRLLKYMVVISGAKRPGEILNEDGAGIAEFNKKAPGCGEYAWEILELYELADPLSWDTIESNEWLKNPPRKPTFVRPAVLDQLMANLKPPLFCQTLPLSEPRASSSTDTQEANDQLLNTIIQYTQHTTQVKEEEDDDDDGEVLLYSISQNTSRKTVTQSNLPASLSDKEHHLNDKEGSNSTLQKYSHRSMTPSKELETFSNLPELPQLSQAETVDLSQSQKSSQQSNAEIVWESPTRPVLLSTQPSLPTPGNREDLRSESHVPYTLVSSQLLTKSQMLPESLLDDSVPAPPLFIHDSDEDEDGI